MSTNLHFLFRFFSLCVKLFLSLQKIMSNMILGFVSISSVSTPIEISQEMEN